MTAQEEVGAAIGAGQEERRAMINVIWSAQAKFSETISEWVECILVSVDQWTQSLCEELGSKIQRVMMLVEARMLGLKTKLVEVRAQMGHRGSRDTAACMDRVR
jgi:hypothetical protein